jgi:hypothetical protein
MPLLGKLPRVRRPALIALFLAVLLPTAAVAEIDPLGTLRDPITESSGLAVSFKDDGYAYTLNDDEESNQLIVYTVRINTGKIIRTTTISNAEPVDPEALALDSKGRLWIADTGADGNRDWETEPPTLYRINEPLNLPSDSDTVRAYRYPLKYSNGRDYDVESLLINPKSGKFSLIRKAPKEDTADHPNRRLQIDPAALIRDQLNTVAVKENLPAISGRVSDGSFTPNAKWAVLRNGGRTAYVYDPSQSPWKLHARVTDLPNMFQEESLSFYKNGSHFLIGSEGDPDGDGSSPLYRIPFDQTKGTGG